MRVVQKIGRDGEIVIRRYPEVPSVPDNIIDAQRLLRFAGPGQLDHFLRQINAGDFRRTPLADYPGVETFPAGDVDHLLAGWIADQPHQRESLDIGAPRLLLRAFVLLRDGIVIRRHARPRSIVKKNHTPEHTGRRGSIEAMSQMGPNTQEEFSRFVVESTEK